MRDTDGELKVMDRIPIVCAAPLHFLPDIVSQLESRFAVSYGFALPKAQVACALAGAKGFIVNPGAPYRIDRELLESAPVLEIVVTPSTGSDHIDQTYCRHRGIELRSLRDREDVTANIHASAEFSFALLLAMIRRLPQGVELARGGRWRDVEDQLRGVELYGKNVGLVGYGRIGKKMSRYLQGFSANVLVFDPFVEVTEPAVTQVDSLNALLAAADIVCAHVHLDESTRHMFDRASFERMRPGSYFLNTSRGGVVVEDALIEALDSGRLTAAAVDVIEGEQNTVISENKLVAYSNLHQNLIVTPHIAGATVESQRKAARFAIDVLQSHFGIECQSAGAAR